jgi:SAM-dependent methyltransferase
MTDDGYALRVAREQNFYTGERPANSLPPIFSYWAARYVAPHLHEIFGTTEVEQFFANEIVRTSGKSQNVSVLSLGSGEASTEIDICKRIAALGKTATFYCTDISRGMNEAAERNSEAAGVSDNFNFIECDINTDFPDCPAEVVIANHSLHHFVELEQIFASVKKQIGRDGAFIVNDMIGRNGHMRWPEVLEFTKALWNLLPPEKRVDRMNGIEHNEFIDWDCADGTFEGIRAQDIMPLLVEIFEFERFFGFGGIADTFVDRMYGHNFSPDSPWDCGFIDVAELTNSALLKNGELKPTAMFATMRLAKFEDEKFWPLSAKEAVRVP